MAYLSIHYAEQLFSQGTSPQVLVIRLAEYKSYMPASLFQRTSTEEFQNQGHVAEQQAQIAA